MKQTRRSTRFAAALLSVMLLAQNVMAMTASAFTVPAPIVQTPGLSALGAADIVPTAAVNFTQNAATQRVQPAIAAASMTIQAPDNCATEEATLQLKKIVTSYIGTGSKTFYFGLFSRVFQKGQIKYVRDTTWPIQSLTFNKPGSKELVFEGLKVGSTYYAFETTQNGEPLLDGSITVGDVPFAIEQGQGAEITPQTAQKTLTITIQNRSTSALVVRFALEGEHQMEGRALKAGELTVQLQKQTAPGVFGEVLASAPNAQSGAFSFSNLPFDAADTKAVYRLCVMEATLENVKLDSNYYLVTVQRSVSQEDDDPDAATDAVNITKIQQYSAQGNLLQDTVKGAPLFVHEYENPLSPPLPVAHILAGTKQLNGGTLQDRQFSFELCTKDGSKVLQTVQNKGEAFAFAPLLFDKEGTYEYLVQEKAESLPNIIYDTTQYQVTVTIEKDADGTLKATSTCQNLKESPAPCTLAFVNQVKPVTPALCILSGTKQLSGGTLQDGQFSFELCTKDGSKVLQTVKNKGEAFTFAPMSFSQEGTYEYLVQEKAESIPNIVYDTTQYNVKIVVQKASDETLVAVATASALNGNGTSVPLAFVNQVQTIVPALCTLSGTKELKGAPLRDKLFAFELCSQGGLTVLQTAKNSGGTFTFAPLSFEVVGTYEYLVREKNEAAPGMQYDTAQYKVLITVQKDSDHILKATATSTLIGGDETACSLAFVNSYTPVHTSANSKPAQYINSPTQKAQNAAAMRMSIKQAQTDSSLAIPVVNPLSATPKTTHLTALWLIGVLLALSGGMMAALFLWRRYTLKKSNR